MTVLLLKMLHIAGIAVWAGGLLALPTLFLQRKNWTGERLHRLHSFTRFMFVGFVSPAAFIAVASGTALIFLQGTFAPWFSWKLVLVAVLGGLHLWSGLIIVKLFEPEGRYTALRAAVASLATMVVAIGILALVLAKPAIPGWPQLEALVAPGQLAKIAGDFIAWWK